ncbi:MAG: hypothetical protein ACR652_17800 [Methylocystis sp.]|uniref:hypothetical protein n=1 Tax=Methylocystis sp. TaxID=1911079 RepID=UPI003DA3DC8B
MSTARNSLLLGASIASLLVEPVVMQEPVSPVVMMYDLSRWSTMLFQDIAGTIPVTADGDLVGCIKSVDDPAFDLVAPDDASRPTFRIDALGRPYVEAGSGKGLSIRTPLMLTIPFYQVAALATTADQTSVSGIKGYLNSADIQNGGFASAKAVTQGVSPVSHDFAEPESLFYAWPILRPAVFDAMMDAGSVSFRQDGIETAGFSPVATTWGQRELFAEHSIYGVNITSQDPANNYVGIAGTGTTHFYGGAFVVSKPPAAQRDALVAYFAAQLEPQIDPADEVILCIGDSTLDDVAVATADEAEELFLSSFHANAATFWPDKTVLYQNHATYQAKEQLTGWRVLQTGASGRVFIYNSSVSGSEPQHFMGARFAKYLERLPHVDRVVWGHGHNMITTDTTGWVRLGNFLDAMDQVRRAFPAAAHMVLRPHPRQTDTLMNGVVAAVDRMETIYGDMQIVNIHDPWVADGKPASRYYDGVHLTVTGAGNGVDAQRAIFDPAYAAWVSSGYPVNPLIDTVSGGLLTNSDFSSWSGGLPTDWTAVGAPTVSQSTNADTSEGDSTALLIDGADGAGLSQSISAVPYRGTEVMVAIRLNGVSGFGGAVKLVVDGTGGGASEEYANGKANGAWRWAYLTAHVPADATTITVTLHGGVGAAGATLYGRAVLLGAIPAYVAPPSPVNIIIDTGFDDPTAWNATTWTVSGSKASTPTSNPYAADQLIPLASPGGPSLTIVNGKTYRITLTIADFVASGFPLHVHLGFGFPVDFSGGDGTYVATGVANTSSTNDIRISGQQWWIGSLTFLKIEEMP